MARYPGAIWKPTPINLRQRPRRAQVRGFQMHSQEGYGSLHGWFSRPDGRGPCHFWIGKNGTVEQYVDTDRECHCGGCRNPNNSSLSTPLTREWARQGICNDVMVSCELEGVVGERMTEWQKAAAVDLIRWVHQVYNLGPVVYEKTLFRHYHMDATACDSNRWDHVAIINEINKPVKPAPPTYAEVREFWDLEDPAKWGAFTDRHIEGLTYLVDAAKLTLKDTYVRWAWATTNVIWHGLGLGYNNAWD